MPTSNMMKTTGSLRRTRDGKEIFHVYFDDGITINMERTRVDPNDFDFDGMLSTGLDSYYLKKGKWPAGANLRKRIELAVALIEKNLHNNRYKIKTKS